MYLLCNGMYQSSVQHTGFCPMHTYWHVLWYVLACIAHILTCIGTQYVLIWIFNLDLEAYVINIVACIRYACACIGMYNQVFVLLDHEFNANIVVRCHTAFQTTFNAIITIHTRIFRSHFDFESTRWSEGKAMAQNLM